MDSVRLNSGKVDQLIYNQAVMKSDRSRVRLRLPRMETDIYLFFWFLSLTILGMYLWVIISNQRFHQLLPFFIFTILIGIHVVLHWWLIRIEDHKRWLALYILVQGGLAFVITQLSGNIGMVFCLYMALIGEVIGLFRISVVGVLTTVFYLIMSLVNLIFILGWKSAAWWALGMIPMIIFVAIYVILYGRQAQATSQAHALLEQLELVNLQLSEYAARVEDLTIAAERQRMARELHDTLSQGLAGLILQLEAVDAHLANAHTDRARVILEETMEQARATLTNARRAIDDLRSPTPRDLTEAARLEADHFFASTGIHCEVEITLACPVPEAVSETALRAIAEGLTNIARHAQAHTARLCIAAQGRALQVEIFDDGVGFDPETVQAGHYGLLGMRERVRLSGGQLEILSSPGRGTQLVIRLPLEKEHLG